MSIIGKLEKITNNGEAEYFGYLQTLTLSLSIRLVPNLGFKSNPNAPDYLINAKVNGGSEIQVGSAWLKTPNNRDSKILEFLSMTIDDPSMTSPLNIAAFPKGDGKWDITYRRRQAVTA